MLNIALLILAILITGLLIFLILEVRKSKKPQEDSSSMQMLLQQMNDLRSNMDEKITGSQKDMSEAVRNQFSESQKLIQRINEQMSSSLLNVTKEITETKEMNKQVFDLAGQLSDLEKVLKNQKTRGNLGEMGLELILSNVLSPLNYEMQYLFKDGKQVDAIIKTESDKFIPVDAKFSLDNYRRLVDETDDDKRAEIEKAFKNDLKKRIDETAQYIRPSEGTLPFAFMFIPAEGIYYDLLINEVGAVKANTRNLIDYAYHDKKVIIVSPTTFSAYLQSVLYGFKAFQIEKSAVEIQKNVQKLGRHLSAYHEVFEKIGNTLGTTVNHYNKASKELGKIDKDITKITGDSPELGIDLIEKPQKD
ncbi:DNA recombination protein RmuC [Candidatus Campbellbacteria bacterium]|nr:DNA recombination protein RmuC [Candidatus Campbellbacteria bacterium]|tara:strand:- start:820 stop:1905 length:1086 start_codon:yes stop_codon:yes gene_type:complete